MKMLRRAGTALLIALAACTDAGPRELVGPEGAKPAQNQVVTTMNICCSATLYKGATYQVYVDIYDQNYQPMNNQTVYWSHGNNGVAIIWGSGHNVTVEAANVGTTTIYASAGTLTRSVTLTVIAAPVVTTVQVTPSPVSLQVGQTRQLTATAYSQYNQVMSGKTATWSTDHSGVASISSGGNLQGVSTGSTTARATIDGVTGTTSVSVTPALYVSLSGTFMITSAGTYDWTASASGGNGTFYYQWEVDWWDTPFEGYVAVDTGNPLYMTLDGCDGGFDLRVKVTSGGSVTYSNLQTVENYAYCW
jgi:hypothetical protein